MAIDITAINNVGEFYSHHYLDAILDKDVKSLLSAWEEAEGNGYVAPHKRLSAQAGKYFKLKSSLSLAVERDELYKISHNVNVNLLEALGYTYQSGAYEMAGDNKVVPVLCSLEKDGNPYLWIIDTYWDLAEDNRVLDQQLLAVQKPEGTDAYELLEGSLENLPGQIFKKSEPPRWLIILSGGRAILIERHKWGQGQYLEFDLDEIMARKTVDNFKALAILLSQEALLPDEANAIHDTLDENSHKHAYAVSSDLKYGIRRAVELLANEYVWYVKNYQQGKGLSKHGLDKQLTTETLTYMYRLLFLFYAEARSGDLGLLPMNSDEYRLGYSMESLRDLEQVKLNTEKARSGYYIHESLEKLFGLINEGHTPMQLELGVTTSVEYGATQSGVFGTGEVAQGRLMMSPSSSKKKTKELYTDYEFSIDALGSPLFDIAKMPLLSKAKFRNVALQEIIQLLSLSKEGRGKKSGRGRISYSQLGINQLGAVYEGLLSYTGFFAKEILYEVKRADDKSEDENRQAYFIPETEIDKYHENEFVRLKDAVNPNAAPKRVQYEQGTFIYRLAGRDREKSASYYTPEVLTKAVVKYSLKELLKDKEADEILRLSICEPAMGSGAFLNEAVNQLAEAYLQRKQTELNQTILPSEYQEEIQKVKAYIATHNCYGVDLNPTAVDLAKVSLWLNVIYRQSKTPWFNLRLSSGNSLIGARLQVFNSADLKTKRSKDTQNYLDKVPARVDMKAGRAEDEIYHFFVPDLGMAGFDKDKVIKGLLPDEVAKIKEWRKSFTKEFTNPQIQTLQHLSTIVDELLLSHLELRQKLLRETTDDIPVWPAVGKPAGSNIHTKEKLEQELYEGSSAYRKLKLVMDYWCSLWFWPVEKASQLPTRDQFIRDCELILEGKTSGSGVISNQTGLAFKPLSKNDIGEAENIDAYGVDKMVDESERLGLVWKTSSSSPFFHWELEYLEIFNDENGFGLILGNPPWIEIDWEEKGVLSDASPEIYLRGMTAQETKDLRSIILEERSIYEEYIKEFTDLTASRNYLTASSNYDLIRGKNNLYKSFITRAWDIAQPTGIIGFVTYEGIYSDPNGQRLRKECYSRQIFHFHFQNEKELFKDVGHAKKFEINVYRQSKKRDIDFDAISNLFHPITIDDSYASDSSGTTPNIKNRYNKWETKGHRNRIITIDINRLSLFRDLIEDDNIDYTEARLPVIHSVEVISFLGKFAKPTQKLSTLVDQYYKTTFWNEVTSQKDGIIFRKTSFPKKLGEIIYSGPHFYVANPYFKTPRRNCSSKGDYDVIDLMNLDSKYLPRTNYLPAISMDDYTQSIPSWHGKKINKYYRLILRAMISPSVEKTLISAIVPPHPAHINSAYTYIFDSPQLLSLFGGLCSSVVFDCYVKIIGKQNLHDTPEQLPIVKRFEDLIIARYLRLNCLTEYYAQLWQSVWKEDFKNQEWTIGDNRLSIWKSLTSRWDRNTPLRNDYERRWCLIELDVLIAKSLGLSIEEFLSIYRIYNPVLKQYEEETYYDKRGCIVFTVNRGLPNVGFIRREWDEIKNVQSGVVERTTMDDSMPKGPIERTLTYEAPFARCDREADYRLAWAEFEKRLGKS
jgi:hypothetical protein